MSRSRVVVAIAALLVFACRASEKAKPENEENWAITTWGERFEIFPEVEPLIAGKVANSHTHVTILSDFSPLKQGSVSAILRGPGGGEEVFKQTTPKRDGIYPIEIKPQREGTFDLFFTIETAAGSEEIPGGSVRVGSETNHGGVADPPRPPNGTTSAEDPEGLSFLKEQQWKVPFATDWVREGEIRASVTGPGRIIPSAGGEVLITAPVDAVVSASPWPHVGLDVASGATVFGLIPAVGAGRSLPELEGEAASLAAEHETARARLARLEDLMKVDAVSRAELEKARATVTGLDARLSATRRDLDTARAARTGNLKQASLSAAAPWSGRIADVRVSPGQSVTAGTVLARFVKTKPIWLEVAFAPADAAAVIGRPEGAVLRGEARTAPYEFGRDAVRLISRSPEIDAQTARQSVRLEIQATADQLPIGSAVEAEVLLAGERKGIVIPDSAVVDDGGTPIVYVQVSGESFSRRAVRIEARQGSRLLVDNLKAGERLVTNGAAAIRRATLLSSGAPEGHVH